MGDMNYSPARNSLHCTIVKQVLEDKGLSSVWDTFPVDFTYTGSDQHIVLGHVVVPNHFLEEAVQGGVVHNLNNTSDHEPVFESFSAEADELAAVEALISPGEASSLDTVENPESESDSTLGQGQNLNGQKQLRVTS